MSLFHKTESLSRSRTKELQYAAKQEQLLQKNAMREIPKWKAALTEKVPASVYHGLRGAFGKAFSLVFEKGTPLIDKTLDHTALTQEYQLQDYAVRLTQSRKELKRMRKAADKSKLLGSAVTMAEGVGLGALGIGMPDIAVFIGMLLRGAYECAVRYGFAYDTPQGRYLILRMMETALLRGDAWTEANAEVDALLTLHRQVTEEELKAQIQRTADAFALDMLITKFVQGLPVVGIAGGIFNPVYYSRILQYVQLKYYKRYLLCLPDTEAERKSDENH